MCIKALYKFFMKLGYISYLMSICHVLCVQALADFLVVGRHLYSVVRRLETIIAGHFLC